MINKVIYGKASISEQGQKNADVNQSDAPDANDSLAIMKYIIKLIDHFEA